jgi:hypothetical protein
VSNPIGLTRAQEEALRGLIENQSVRRKWGRSYWVGDKQFHPLPSMPTISVLVRHVLVEAQGKDFDVTYVITDAGRAHIANIDGELS